MLEVTQFQIDRLLDMYRDALAAKFSLKLLTPATVVQMENYLAAFQQTLLKRETNKLYQLPVRLVIIGATKFDVDLDPQAMVKVINP